MRKDEQRWKYEDPSNRDDLWIAVITLVMFAIIFAMTGCTFARVHPEPVWAPNVYLYSPKENRCLFVNGEGHRIDCDEPLINDMVLLPSSDLKEVMTKFQRCREWE